MRKFFLILAFFCLFGGVYFAWRLRPILGENESYNNIFPKEQFLAKIHSSVPEWMDKQLDADFKEVTSIQAQALEKAYNTILERIKEPAYIHHYRILDNQLYKYIPSGTHFSSRDSYYEKSLKTLLSHISLPDLDFILCPMDGIPEAILPHDFYLMDDPKEQVPILGQAKLKEPLTHLIILIPDQLSLSPDWLRISEEILTLNGQIPWAKKSGKAFWRGGMSDNVGPLSQLPIVNCTPRLSLCRISKRFPDFVDAASCYCPSMMEIVQNEELNKCDVLVSKLEHLRCKYLPSLDGNMCTYPGLQWRLLSDALTLKQRSLQIQWFYSALEPYKHYLPIANNMGDLIEKIKWAEGHEGEVLEIIANAQRFACDNLRYEDCYRYFYLVLQKYAALQEINFQDLKQKTKNDPHWVNIQYRKRLSFYKTFSHICLKSLMTLE
jgi:hypothetical protein